MNAMGNRRLASAVLALAVGLTAQLTGQSRFTKQDGDRFQEKLSRINAFAAAPQASATASGSRTAASAPAAAQTTQLSDVEVNSYLRYNIKDQVPVGIAAVHQAGALVLFGLAVWTAGRLRRNQDDQQEL